MLQASGLGRRYPKLGRAEALRRAMLTYLNDGADPENAYPAFWGRSRSSARVARDERGVDALMHPS
jgi:hypothetical protein